MADLEYILQDLPEVIDNLKLNIGGNYNMIAEIKRIEEIQIKREQVSFVRTQILLNG